MSVGLAVTKSEIDSRAGELARNFQRSFEQVLTLKAYLDATPDQDLVDLGYSSGEVAVLKTALADLTTLQAVWSGAATQGSLKDFTTFVRQLWGLGAF